MFYLVLTTTSGGRSGQIITYNQAFTIIICQKCTVSDRPDRINRQTEDQVE